MQKITPFLWFNNNADEAMAFYSSVFPNARIISRGPRFTFELEGQSFFAINGGPHYSFTPAISLYVNCETQEEIDYFWDKLSDGGQVMRCGWLKDRFGLTWQIVPAILGTLLGGPDPAQSVRVMQALMQMVKLDIAGLLAAAAAE